MQSWAIILGNILQRLEGMSPKSRFFLDYQLVMISSWLFTLENMHRDNQK